MTEQQTILMIAGIFLFIGAAFALVPIIMNKHRKKKAAQCDCETTATVAAYACYGGSSDCTYAPIYSYWVNEKEYKKTSKYSFSGQKFSVGDKVALRYNSSNPDIFFVDAEQFIIKFLSVIFGIISAVMILIGILMIVEF